MPENYHALGDGTQEFIRDLLRKRDEARRQLEAAQTDQAIIRGQLTTADSQVANKFLYISPFYYCTNFLPLMFFLSDLESQVQILLDVARTPTVGECPTRHSCRSPAKHSQPRPGDRRLWGPSRCCRSHRRGVDHVRERLPDLPPSLP